MSVRSFAARDEEVAMPVPEPIKPPQLHVDDIEVLELLGRGATSFVYKARQRKLDRLVALKVLVGDEFADETGPARFRREARLSSLLDHPNIAKTLAYGISHEGTPYLVMEYLNGRTLAEELKAVHRLQLKRFKGIFLDLLSSLDCAHGAGLVHRDIKPGNIMICLDETGGENVKLLDFGIAREVVPGPGTAQKLTRTGTMLGSPAYMSPEQCAGSTVDARSDIYSLCCVMYEALCGEPPYSADSSLELMGKHLHSLVPTEAEFSAKIEISRGLARVVLWGLQKDPDSRPRSAGELAGKLLAALDEITLERVPRLKTGSKHSHPLRNAALGLLVVAAFCGMGLWLQRLHTNNNGHKEKIMEGEQRLLSIHDLEAKAAKLNRDGRGPEALTYWDVAIDRLERSRPPRKSEAVRLLRSAINQTGIDSPQTFNKLLSYADKGIELVLELPDEEGIEPTHQDHFSFFSEKKLEFLRSQSRNAEACAAALEFIKRADRKWGKESKCGSWVRLHASMNFYICKDYDKARGLAQEALSFTEGRGYFTERIMLQEQLAHCCLAQNQTGEFISLCRKIRNDIYGWQHVSPGDRLGAVESLLKLFEHSHNAECEAMMRNELNARLETCQEDPEMRGRVAADYYELARHFRELKDYKNSCKELKTCLSQAYGPPERKTSLLRKRCLADLVTVSRLQNDAVAAAAYQKQLDRQNAATSE